MVYNGYDIKYIYMYICRDVKHRAYSYSAITALIERCSYVQVSANDYNFLEHSKIKQWIKIIL